MICCERRDAELKLGTYLSNGAGGINWNQYADFSTVYKGTNDPISRTISSQDRQRPIVRADNTDCLIVSCPGVQLAGVGEVVSVDLER